MPTVSGTVTDGSGNTAPWSASWTVATSQQTTPLPYVGSSMEGNADPAPLETAAGRKLGIRRTYWNLNTSGGTNVNSAVTTATADVAKGRIPWISFKLRKVPDATAPNGERDMTWDEAVAGQADADIRSLNTRLAAIPGPVWVAIHHEPEGDGNLGVWRSMQQRLLPLFTAANVRTSIITTGYDTWFSGNSSYSMANLWPGSMCSIMGTDRYNPPTGWQEMKVTYDAIAADAKARGVDWAIAETGYTDAQAAQDPDWLTRAFDDMKNHAVQPGIGLSYFNSTANSGTNSWPLGTGTKLTKFCAILNRSHT